MKRRLSFIIFMLFSCFFALLVTKAEVVSEEELSDIDPAKRYMLEKTAETTKLSNAYINGVSVNGSIATITSTGSVAAYYIGTTNSVSASTTYSATSTSNRYYVGVKNGTYYFWISGYGSNLGTVPYVHNPVTVTSSCTTQYATNVTNNTVYVQACFVSTDGGKFVADGNPSQSFVQCAPGYVTNQSLMRVVEDTCSNTSTRYQGQQLRKAYCKKVYSVSCVPKSSVEQPIAPSLSSLEVSNGALSPGFNPGTNVYNVNVSAETSTIAISATPTSGSSFVNNYGPKSYNLSYGLNRFYIKVSNASGNIVTYTINITRQDNRSNVNTLSSLTVSQGELSPGFSADNTTYSLIVPNNVSSLAIGAVLSDVNSYFEDGFGPRTVNLNEGLNNILVKVRSQAGTLRAYTVNVSRQTAEETICSTESETKALLSKIEFLDGPDGELIDKLEIKSDVFTYEVEVPFDVENLTINAFPVTEGDTFDVKGIQHNLVVDEPQEATIVVSSAMCVGLSKTYTLSIKRTSHSRFSNDARLLGLEIEGHKEFKFEIDKHDYDLNLNKKETSLQLKISAADNAQCSVEGNTALKTGSKVEITCVAEDQETTSKYTISVKSPKKGMPLILVILIVLIVILGLVYLVLRLLGYRIYFNFSAISAMFREMKEKKKNK